MGRPPCCDKIGVKKGPWTPEEDIILVSYIQEHGPGNWRAVPTNTGLLRCSKSCRLRWTNYLRPGIKRGNFTDQEEKLIIHLQALLGNRFDIVFVLLDTKNPEWNVIVSLDILAVDNEAKRSKDGEELADVWSLPMQRRYVHYVKGRFRPVLTKESEEIISSYYQLQRRVAMDNAARTTVCMLESLIQLAQALRGVDLH